MTTQLTQKCRRSLVLVTLGLAVCLVASGAAHSVTGAAAAEQPATVLVHELDGYRFEYHVPTGTETLYAADAEAAFVNVLSEHEDVAARCRTALESRLGVERLEVLRARYADTVRRLHALGYL
jgi:hypothetical protein